MSIHFTIPRISATRQAAFYFFVAFVACAIAVGAAQDPKKMRIEDTPGLPRVLLIGDSISMGYTLPTRELLKDKANVHRPPANCASTREGLANLDGWLGDKPWDVIHFNWGLHDLKTVEGVHNVPLEEYEKNLRALVAQLKKTGAVLIWSATTPAPEDKVEPPRSNDDVKAYNKVARRIMEENGVATNDLYGFAAERLKEIQRPANVHFTPEGSEALAREVARHIEIALEKDERAADSGN